MYLGQLIMSGQTARTGWIPSGGASARFTYEYISAGGTLIPSQTPSGEITITVYTKNTEDQGDGTAVGGAATMSSAGFTVKEITGGSGLKELVCFEIDYPTETTTYDSESWNTARWVYFRILTPVWYNKA
ncbi:MAG: hypothetical protein R3F30_04445 [Planctomycetota bacterium]